MKKINKNRSKIKMEKILTGSDKILNLKEISIGNIDSFSSSSCSGGAIFDIDCSTKHGYCEDPNFLGVIKVLSIEKGKSRNTYNLKIKFVKEDEHE